MKTDHNHKMEGDKINGTFDLSVKNCILWATVADVSVVAVCFDAPDKFSLFLGCDLSGKSFQSALSLFTVNGPS